MSTLDRINVVIEFTAKKRSEVIINSTGSIFHVERKKQTKTVHWSF